VGIKAAKGDYIAIFDTDDIMMPEKIGLQAELLDKNPEVNLVFTDFCNFEGDRILTNHFADCVIFKSLPTQRATDKGYVLNGRETYETLLIENFIGASSMMFRKSAGDAIGGFDETLDSSEDIDFSLKMVQTGKVGFIDKVCHLRRLHGNSMSARTEKVLTRKLRVYCRHLSGPKSTVSQRRLTNKIANMHCALAYFYRENRRYREAFRAYLAALKMRPSNWPTYRKS
jgi:GT2 family glycosyltransferase